MGPNVSVYEVPLKTVVLPTADTFDIQTEAGLKKLLDKLVGIEKASRLPTK
jgi:hypothetical protein